MPRYTVIAFDCDGVLFDTREANKVYYNTILAHFDKPPMTPGQFAYVHMHTVDESLAYLFEDPDAIRAANARRGVVKYADYLKYLSIEPHLRPLLAALPPRYHTAVATNRTDTMHPLLKSFDLEDDFDLVVTALDVNRPKPQPDQLLKVAEHFQVCPEEILYIGDSPVDEQAAEAAGVPLAAYDNPDLRARYHISSLQELFPLLDLEMPG